MFVRRVYNIWLIRQTRTQHSHAVNIFFWLVSLSTRNVFDQFLCLFGFQAIRMRFLLIHFKKKKTRENRKYKTKEEEKKATISASRFVYIYPSYILFIFIGAYLLSYSHWAEHIYLIRRRWKKNLESTDENSYWYLYNDFVCCFRRSNIKNHCKTCSNRVRGSERYFGHRKRSKFLTSARRTRARTYTVPKIYRGMW